MKRKPVKFISHDRDVRLVIPAFLVIPAVEFSYTFGDPQPSRLTKVVERAKKAGKRSITVYKKANLRDQVWNDLGQVIVELKVPVRAKMRQPKNEKCRASSATVVRFWTLHRKPKLLGRKLKVTSQYNGDFKYKRGITVRPTRPFYEGNTECSTGIHFFLTFKEARNY